MINRLLPEPAERVQEALRRMERVLIDQVITKRDGVVAPKPSSLENRYGIFFRFFR